MSVRIWKAGNHELAQTVVRSHHEPREEVVLEMPAGGSARWRVLSVEKDPHGWKITATRCLSGCREHAASIGGK